MVKLSPLVSVVVVTYNSSKFILETLESIKNQTYPSIEVIITDDCSTDNTVEVCRNWLSENKRCFIHNEIITASKNTGTASNSNRGFSATRGTWIKFCCGDDTLLPNCLEDNMQFVNANQNIKILFSYCRMYLENLTEDCFVGNIPRVYPSNIISTDISAEEQYKLLLVGNRIPFTPSAFVHRDTMQNFGIIDEKYFFSEDYLRWLSFTKNGVKLHFMEKETVKYRMHPESLSKQSQKYIVNPVYFKTEASLRKYSYPFIPWDIRFSKSHVWIMSQLFRIDFFNRNTTFNSYLFYTLNTLLNPFRYVSYVKSHFIQKYRSSAFYK